ncbi:TIGR02281 family clan AA aspartic protease [Actibacterium sp. 188UL27-1]|uniref:retropepsin-like aspartic protease family protein n=1 Tax=Actibacterium sp. 188UL27-1 TaxID=2786961 RepID=UPI00195B5398|nr:TIGR02281 family clan AA aspartic protease [Actibacterium sp. 188UL27-1]MBM7067491.1 TIGR02281 family clan AA aspartic protease [Actibacterium sp. 188UL27-1]
MSGDNFASLIYLVLLGTVIASYFFMSGRQNLSKTAQQAAIWGLIFVGVIVGYGLWNDLSNTVNPRQASFDNGERIEVPLGNDGHYHLTLNINGQPIDFVVDTGATDLVLSKQDARRAGLNPDTLRYDGVAGTANGRVETARVRLEEVELGGITETGVSAVVNGGELDISLLGMTYLSRWARVEFGGNRMVLTR